MKIRPVGAELFHTEEQTDRHDEENSRFAQCCEIALKFLWAPEDILWRRLHENLRTTALDK
jgi:hypothetical protein